MARIRTVKPELFMDEDLGALSGDHVALFVALWTQADRDGRLEDRPARIRAATFPYRKVDVDALLADLEHVDKVIRYEADGVAVIAIPGFQKHQRPHPKEPSSMLPPPPSRGKKRQAILEASVIPSSPVGREGEGREGDLVREGKGTEHPPPPAVPVNFIQDVTPPTSEPVDWTGDDFWRWYQSKRQKVGFVAEKPPRPEKLGPWWSNVRMVVSTEMLREGAIRFSEDQYWQRKDPPLPFQAFMSQWERYTRQLEVSHA